jgi:hypothetical protein
MVTLFTGRISPEVRRKPKQNLYLQRYLHLTIQNGGAKSMAGSSTEIPPVMFKKTSFHASFHRFHKT